MILFYSTSCQHCSVLLDTIKRHDTKKTIKLVCIDTKISLVKSKITNVPALMFLPTKEVIYGKAVFDYLLLPNRGYLFSNNSTREKGSNDPSSLNAPIPMNNQITIDEPHAFALGSVLGDSYSDIDDNNSAISVNKNYKWDLIDGVSTSPPPADKDFKEKADKKLPSLEELTKERENLFKDIK
jgi:hypothetical protein